MVTMKCTYRDKERERRGGGEHDSLRVFLKKEKIRRESVMKSDLAIDIEKDPRFRVITVRISLKYQAPC